MIFFFKSLAVVLLLFVSRRAALAQSDNILLAPITSTLHILDDLDLGKLLQQLGASNRPSGVLAPVNNQVLKVVASVRAGDNQEFKQVLVDTGSAILWVGAEEKYEVGPDTEDINATFSIGYGIGGAAGTAYKDTVTIGQATANSQFIGAANTTSGLTLVKPIDGILGLGTSQSNAGDISGFNSTPTFVETLVSEGSIDQPMFGLYIAPLEDTNEDGQGETAGEISFGGPDSARYTGQIEWLQQLPPFNFRWEFNISGMSFGNVSTNNTIFGRTDSGVLSIAIPSDQLFEIINNFSGHIIGQGPLLGFLSLPAPPPNELYTTYPPLIVTLGSQQFSINSTQYLIPKNLYAQLNLTDTIEVPVDPENPDGEQEQIQVVNTWISSGGTGSFNLGQKWLEGVYTVYDMANHRVGFAHLK